MSRSDQPPRTTAETWTRLIEIDRLNPPPAGTFVSAGGRELVVFALPDPHGIVVIDNACPHAHGNLSGGTLEGTVVECPWHQWRFDLSRGVCLHSDAIRVRKYATRVRDGALFAKLADLPPIPRGDHLLA